MWAQFCEKYAPSAEENKVSVEVANIKYVIDYFNHTYNNVHAAINELAELERLAHIGKQCEAVTEEVSFTIESITFNHEQLSIDKLIAIGRATEKVFKSDGFIKVDFLVDESDDESCSTAIIENEKQLLEWAKGVE